MTLLLALVLAASDGGSVEWLGPPLKTPVRRVITLAPSLTETVIQLGAASTLVGVSRFDESAEVKSLPRAGGFNDVDVETIVRLKPDVLLVQRAPGNQLAVEQLGRLKVSILVLSLTTVADCTRAISEIAAVLERREAATRLNHDIEKVRSEVRERAQRRAHKPKVLLAYGFSPLIVAGPGSFAHELLQDCGVRNLAEKAPSPYPSYSLEQLVADPPDIIIDGADVPAGKELIQKLGRLKNVRWVTLPSKDLLHPGPALARGLRELDAVLFPPSDDSARTTNSERRE